MSRCPCGEQSSSLYKAVETRGCVSPNISIQTTGIRVKTMSRMAARIVPSVLAVGLAIALFVFRVGAHNRGKLVVDYVV